MCDRPLPGRCRSSPPSTSSAYERCLPESRPKAERFTPVRRRSDELCSGCRCPKWWKECPGTTPGFHGGRSGSAEDCFSRRRVPGRGPGLQKSTPTRIRSGTAQHCVPPRESWSSSRPAPARTFQVVCGCGFGSARRVEWTGATNGPDVGQVAGVGPVHVAKPSGGFASGRPAAAKLAGRAGGVALAKFSCPAWAALVPA